MLQGLESAAFLIIIVDQEPIIIQLTSWTAAIQALSTALVSVQQQLRRSVPTFANLDSILTRWIFNNQMQWHISALQIGEQKIVLSNIYCNLGSSSLEELLFQSHVDIIPDNICTSMQAQATLLSLSPLSQLETMKELSRWKWLMWNVDLSTEQSRVVSNITLGKVNLLSSSILPPVWVEPSLVSTTWTPRVSNCQTNSIPSVFETNGVFVESATLPVRMM